MEPFPPLYAARRRWSDRIPELQLPLFPSCVFCRFNPHSRTPVQSMFGIVRFVKTWRVLIHMRSRPYSI